MTGPNPTDRGRPGSKHHVLVDRHGTPLALILSPANRHDSLLLEPILDAVPPLRGRRGRPRRRPGKLHADKAYDHHSCRQACRRRGIIPRLARRGVDSSEKLGRHRWVVERTIAWLHRLRRLILRYERRADIHEALLLLPAALVTFQQLTRLC
jgi:transposase